MLENKGIYTPREIQIIRICGRVKIKIPVVVVVVVVGSSELRQVVRVRIGKRRRRAVFVKSDLSVNRRSRVGVKGNIYLGVDIGLVCRSRED